MLDNQENKFFTTEPEPQKVTSPELELLDSLSEPTKNENYLQPDTKEYISQAPSSISPPGGPSAADKYESNQSYSNTNTTIPNNSNYYSYNWDGRQEMQNRNTNTAKQVPGPGYYNYSGNQLNNAKNAYYNYTAQPVSGNYAVQQPVFTTATQNQVNRTKGKKTKAKHSGAMAVLMAFLILFAFGVGIGGGYYGFYAFNAVKNNISDDLLVIKKDDSAIITEDVTSENNAALATSEIAKIAADSVVEITTEIVNTSGFASQYVQSGAGSGVIISDNGYIVTNNHVIEDASKITVTLRDGTIYEAELKGTDKIADIALIKIDASGLKAATLGDSDKLNVGDKTVAIGNPLGQLGGTVTDGIISALSRDVVIDNVTMTLLQTNAAINPGNSGGGLFDGRGRLIGIVNAKSAGTEIEGLGFAIPVNNVSAVLDDLKQYGYVRGRVRMGVTLLDIQNPAYAMMYRVSELGCYVQKIETNSAAAKAGFQIGDRIVKVNGTKIQTSSEVKAEINKQKVGDKATFEIVRDNQTKTISLILEEEVPDLTHEENNSKNFNQEPDRGNSIWDYFNW